MIQQSFIVTCYSSSREGRRLVTGERGGEEGAPVCGGRGVGQSVTCFTSSAEKILTSIPQTTAEAMCAKDGGRPGRGENGWFPLENVKWTINKADKSIFAEA